MKKSNALIIAGLGLTLISLIAYDFELKAEYESGRYKIPYQNFRSMSFKDFDILDLHSSTAANVKFIQGPFNVLVQENAMSYIRINQDGSHLKIDAAFEADYQGNPEPYVVIISCPNLAEVNTNATYMANGRQVTDSFVRDDWKMRQVLIEGFRQDSISILQDYASAVVVDSSHIRSVHAVLGESKGSGSNLIIRKSNQFDNAFFDVGEKSKLFLENAVIRHLNYQLADNAQLIVVGRAKNLIDNSENTGK